MDEASYKTRLLDVMRRAHADQEAWLAGLSDADRAEAGSPDHWSAKDHVAHLAAWQISQAERLEAVARGETPGDGDDFLVVNERLFAENRDKPWSEVSPAAEQASARLAVLVERFSDEELADPERFPALKGASVASRILIDDAWHIYQHLAQFYADRGNLARAGQIQEELAHAMADFDPSPRSRSIARYNLACFYALHGRPERALELLPEAFRLNPDLIEWSKNDTDLDSLRDNPAYQALVA